MSTVDANLSISISVDDTNYLGNEFEYDYQYIRVKTETKDYCLKNINKLVTELKLLDKTINIYYITDGEYQGYFKINSNNNSLIDHVKTKLLELEKEYLNKKNKANNQDSSIISIE